MEEEEDIFAPGWRSAIQPINGRREYRRVDETRVPLEGVERPHICRREKGKGQQLEKASIQS